MSTNKESFQKFVNCIQKEIFDQSEKYDKIYKEDWSDICNFWTSLCNASITQKFTTNGHNILLFMQNNIEKYNNIFKAKDIGEGLFISSKSVSGSMQKLVKEGFCEKLGGSPVCYKLTEQGKNEELDFQRI